MNGDVRIISATETTNTSRSGSTVGRMRRTIIAFGILTIDLSLLGQD